MKGETQDTFRHRSYACRGLIVYERNRRRVKPKLSMWLVFLGLALLLAFILWRAKPAMILKYGVVVAPAVSIVLLTELIGQNIRKTSEHKARLFRRILIASGIAVWIGACAFFLIRFKTEPPLWLILGFGNGLIIGGSAAGKDPRTPGGWKPPAWKEPSEQGKGSEESSGEVK